MKPLLLVILLLCLARAASGQQEQQQEPATEPAAVEANDDDDPNGAAAILSAMATRAQLNSLSQTLITLVALASDEAEESSSAEANATAAAADNATVAAPPFRNDVLLRAHLEELVAEQERGFINAFAASSSNSSNSSSSSTPTTQLKSDSLSSLTNLLAAIAARRAAAGPLSVRLRDALVMGVGRTVRAATTEQPGAGPCGQYEWDAGGEYTPAIWTGPTVSVSLSLGSCAVVPSLEGPGAALSAGSAWTNAVGELACLGPGLSYALTPLLTYTSAGITGEALSGPSCRLSASFGPSLSLKATGGSGSSSYPSEGAFLAGALLNATLDKRINRLQRALDVWAAWKGGEDGEEGGREEEGVGGDYELQWEKGPGAGDEGGLRSLKPLKPLVRALLSQAREAGWGGGGGGGGASGGFENAVVAAMAAAEAADAAAEPFENRVAG